MCGNTCPFSTVTLIYGGICDHGKTGDRRRQTRQGDAHLLWAPVYRRSGYSGGGRRHEKRLSDVRTEDRRTGKKALRADGSGACGGLRQWYGGAAYGGACRRCERRRRGHHHAHHVRGFGELRALLWGKTCFCGH